MRAWAKQVIAEMRQEWDSSFERATNCVQRMTDAEVREIVRNHPIGPAQSAAAAEIRRRKAS